MVFWTSVGQCTVGDLVRWVDSELMRPSLLSNTSLHSISGGAMTRSHCTRSQERSFVLRMQMFFSHGIIFLYINLSYMCTVQPHENKLFSSRVNQRQGWGMHYLFVASPRLFSAKRFWSWFSLWLLFSKSGFQRWEGNTLIQSYSQLLWIFIMFRINTMK